MRNIDDSDESIPYKGKRKHKPTSCLSKTNMFGHCRICGSDNIIQQVYVWCEVCKKEVFDIMNDHFFLFQREVKFCECIKMMGLHRYSPYHSKGIRHCSDCSAYEGPLCPNCKKPMWFKFDKGIHKVSCQCGFRKEF